MAEKQRDNDQELVVAALRSLEAVSGITGRVLIPEQVPGLGWDPDAQIELHIDGRYYHYFVQCTPAADRRARIAQVQHQFEGSTRPGLFVAPHLTPAMAEHCRQLDLPFIDGAGNAYLRRDGLYVYVVGQKPKKPLYRRDSGLGSPAALRMIFALLCRPELTQASYREIVDAAGVSLGMVGRVFEQLQSRGFVTDADSRYGRRPLEFERLLEEWVALYPSILRPKLKARRFRAQDPMWWTTFHPPSQLAWWGGEVAAERLTDYLKPATQTLYVAPDASGAIRRELVQRYRLRPDPDGAVEVLEAFWRFPTTAPRADVVPPELVYADLLLSLDPRCLEVAKMLREEVIGHVDDKA